MLSALFAMLLAIGITGCSVVSGTGSANSDSWEFYFHNDLGFHASVGLCSDSHCTSTYFTDHVSADRDLAENVATGVANWWLVQDDSGRFIRCLTHTFVKYEHLPVLQLSSGVRCDG